MDRRHCGEDAGLEGGDGERGVVRFGGDEGVFGEGGEFGDGELDGLVREVLLDGGDFLEGGSGAGVLVEVDVVNPGEFGVRGGRAEEGSKELVAPGLEAFEEFLGLVVGDEVGVHCFGKGLAECVEVADEAVCGFGFGSLCVGDGGGRVLGGFGKNNL